MFLFHPHWSSVRQQQTVQRSARSDHIYTSLYCRRVSFYKEPKDGKINKYILCFWSRSRVRPRHVGRRRGQTMFICSNRYWSRWGWNCAVQSTTAGLKRPQQRRWKNEARFCTTPMLQTDEPKRDSQRCNHNFHLVSVYNISLLVSLDSVGCFQMDQDIYGSIARFRKTIPRNPHKWQTLFVDENLTQGF